MGEKSSPQAMMGAKYSINFLGKNLKILVNIVKRCNILCILFCNDGKYLHGSKVKSKKQVQSEVHL